MAEKAYKEAETRYTQALKTAADDYAGLVKLAKCQLAQEKYTDAQRNIQLAREVYPQEAQADYLGGVLSLNLKQYEAAYRNFDAYDQKLPGNPNVIFYKGLSLEGQERIDPAAANYQKYLQVVQEGKQAQHAYERLKEWGYIK